MKSTTVFSLLLKTIIISMLFNSLQAESLLSLKKKGPVKRMKAELMSDEKFLDILQKRCVMFFWKEADPDTGLVKDRANNFTSNTNKIASIASTGFGITALIIARKRGWLTHDQVYNRILTTLKYARDKLYHKNGFFFHWLNMKTGKREWNSEISSVDTALFIMGALFAGEYYKGTEIDKIADFLYKRINWEWMRNGKNHLTMGYAPNKRAFLNHYWSTYSETMFVLVLAIGSPDFPVDKKLWKAMHRLIGNYKEYKCIAYPPLFTHQYHNLWIDFRNKHDNIANYFENTRIATLANRRYCIDKMNRYKSYGTDSWGLTACDGPNGYKAYGGMPGAAFDDGTIAPTAAGGSIVFTIGASYFCIFI